MLLISGYDFCKYHVRLAMVRHDMVSFIGTATPRPIMKKSLIDPDQIGRVSSEDEKRVCSCETRSQCEHIFKNFNCLTRE